jgi:GxxExxY protein
LSEGCRRIPFLREHSIPISYKGHPLGTPYRADFVCRGSIIVELKAIQLLTDMESAQVLHYLKATGFDRALLLNFARPRLEPTRFIRSETHLRASASSAVQLLFQISVPSASQPRFKNLASFKPGKPPHCRLRLPALPGFPCLP